MTANNTEPVPIRCERCDDTLSNNGTIQSAGHPGCGDIDGPGHRFAVSEAQLQRICASERLDELERYATRRNITEQEYLYERMPALQTQLEGETHE